MTNKTEAQILANLPCVVFRCEIGETTICTYISDGANGLFQTAASDFISGSKTFLEFVHPDDLARVEKNALSAMNIAGLIGSSRFEMEYRIVDAKGQLHWIVEQGFVKSLGPNSYQRDGLFFDMTPHKEAAEIVADHQTRVATSSRMASLSEMATGIAHEINNPLAIIKARAAQLHAHIEQNRAAAHATNQTSSYEFFLKIANNIDLMTDRISKIVKSLRTLARDSSGDQFEDADLRALVTDALELCRQKMLDAGIRVEATGLDEPIPIVCKPIQLSQVLMHLLNNAYDAVESLDDKFVSVDVTSGEDFVDIKITDSGAGISGTLSDKIFQPFFSTKEVGKGAGLGLSVSKSYINAHGGKLVLDSESKNTRFVITIPTDPQRLFRAS